MIKLCPFWKLNIKLQLHGQLIFLNGIIYERGEGSEEHFIVLDADFHSAIFSRSLEIIAKSE
jgi:hypothetical protein